MKYTLPWSCCWLLFNGCICYSCTINWLTSSYVIRLHICHISKQRQLNHSIRFARWACFRWIDMEFKQTAVTMFDPVLQQVRGAVLQQLLKPRPTSSVVMSYTLLTCFACWHPASDSVWPPWETFCFSLFCWIFTKQWYFVIVWLLMRWWLQIFRNSSLFLMMTAIQFRF